ncbi:hypothetical protein SRB5_69340 [Streptomyces sp. RB5]|uniref:Penicillin-binding protein n=1 Tax=Streptomyces smaragdinus TaxID=2585196 RepID=A0A7K0CUS3_9ACTN|nr:penicillin-binding transpeptidase domain-containing protein [Streptomyces smaragdinus]MQY16732.1 hypothetical protein [Streptomyces smaragdinus]
MWDGQQGQGGVGGAGRSRDRSQEGYGYGYGQQQPGPYGQPAHGGQQPPTVPEQGGPRLGYYQTMRQQQATPPAPAHPPAQPPTHGGRRRKPAEKPPWQKWALIGGAAAVVIAAAGFGTYAMVGGDEGPGVQETAAKINTAPPTAQEVGATGKRFLKAWTTGQTAKAAVLTDDATGAQAALQAYTTDVAVTKLAVSPGTPLGGKLPYTVRAQVKHGEVTAPWSYEAQLTVVRDKRTGRAVIDWQPSILHPKLGEGETLHLGEQDAPPVKALDRTGKELDLKTYPSLAPVVDSLREKYGKKAGGSADVEIWIEPAKAEKGEKATSPETLLVLAEGKPGSVKTTLDAKLQAVAEAQVKKAGKSSVTAVRPSTGEILALANSPAGGFDTALQGSLAPGSTMKVVTASLLLDKGLAESTKEHPCPKYVTYGNWKFQNVDKFELPEGSTFAQSFANSCNTAFIGMAPKLKDDDLTKQARDVFGIGLNWAAGVSTFDGRVPVQTKAQMAASLIGQGGVRANPLVMASVSATVKSGVFKQPYLVDPAYDGRTLAKAPRTMKPESLAQLRGMMKETVIWGTAAEALKGVGGDVGAKTGTSEVDGQKKPNAWFTAYRDDIAAAAVVPETGHGGEFAGPLVRALLTAG